MAERDPIGAYIRTARAQRRVGVGARCTCGESRPFALLTGKIPAICFYCDRKVSGGALTEDHHVFGEANSTLEFIVPVNDHRAVLSVAQYSWPPKTLSNEHHCELREAAARLRGLVDMWQYMVDDNRASAEALERRCEAECGHPHQQMPGPDDNVAGKPRNGARKRKRG